jgi:hypothetical protein
MAFLSLDHRLDLPQILLLERVGVVLEFAFVFEVDLDHLDGPVAEDRRQSFACHAIGGINSDLHLPDGGLKELEDVLLVLSGQILSLKRSGRTALGMGHSQGEVLNVLEPGVAPDGDGAASGDLESVVFGGIVGCGDLDSAAGTEVIDGEVHLGRIDHANVNDTDARGPNPFDEGLGQRLAVRSHIAADDDGLGPGLPAFITRHQGRQKACAGTTDLPCILLSQLVGIKAPDIVCFENLWIHSLSSFGLAAPLI